MYKSIINQDDGTGELTILVDVLSSTNKKTGEPVPFSLVGPELMTIAELGTVAPDFAKARARSFLADLESWRLDNDQFVTAFICKHSRTSTSYLVELADNESQETQGSIFAKMRARTRVRITIRQRTSDFAWNVFAVSNRRIAGFDEIGF